MKGPAQKNESISEVRLDLASAKILVWIASVGRDPDQRDAAQRCRTGLYGRRSTQESGSTPVVFQQRLDLSTQGLIAVARVSQERSTFGCAASERFVVQPLDRRPAVRRHHAGNLSLGIAGFYTQT